MRPARRYSRGVIFKRVGVGRPYPDHGLSSRALGRGAAAPGPPRPAGHHQGHPPARRPARRGLDVLRRPLRPRRRVAGRVLPRGRPAPRAARRPPAAQRPARPRPHRWRADDPARAHDDHPRGARRAARRRGRRGAGTAATKPLPAKVDSADLRRTRRSRPATRSTPSRSPSASTTPAPARASPAGPCSCSRTRASPRADAATPPPPRSPTVAIWTTEPDEPGRAAGRQLPRRRTSRSSAATARASASRSSSATSSRDLGEGRARRSSPRPTPTICSPPVELSRQRRRTPVALAEPLREPTVRADLAQPLLGLLAQLARRDDEQVVAVAQHGAPLRDDRLARRGSPSTPTRPAAAAARPPRRRASARPG